MADLLRQYFNIAFLMGRPQDLPGGEQQLRIGVLLAFLTYTIALVGLYGVPHAAAHAFLDIGLTGGALWTSLQLRGQGERFSQAFGGFCGAAAYLNAAAIPIYLGQDEPGAGASFAEFVLLVWNLSLLGHVIRHTFEVKLSVSILIAFLYVIVLTGLLGALLPATPVGSSTAML